MSRPLPAACSDRPRRSKSLLLKRISNNKRYFFSPGRSRPPAPTGPGAQSRYVSVGVPIKNNTFPVPAPAGSLLQPAPALKVDTFLIGLQTKKTIFFQSRPLPAACSNRPRRSKSILFDRISRKKQYFSVPAALGRLLEPRIHRMT